MNYLTPEGDCDGTCFNNPSRKNCDEISQCKQYICTQPKNHAGDHIACGPFKHNYKRWPQTLLSPSPTQSSPPTVHAATTPNAQPAPSQQLDVHQFNLTLWQSADKFLSVQPSPSQIAEAIDALGFVIRHLSQKIVSTNDSNPQTTLKELTSSSAPITPPPSSLDGKRAL